MCNLLIPLQPRWLIGILSLSCSVSISQTLIQVQNKPSRLKVDTFDSKFPLQLCFGCRGLWEIKSFSIFSPSSQNVTSIPCFFFFLSAFYKQPLAGLKSFNVKSICFLPHVREASRAIICTFARKVVWRGDEDDRSGVKLSFSGHPHLRPFGCDVWMKMKNKA